MSELKFRAWSIEYEEYIEDVIHDGPSWLEAHGYDYVTVSEIFDGDEFIVEQYTGLKDKNGKEIYEGDIVTLNGEWEEIEHGDCSIVTFENGCFRVGDGYENEAGSYLSDWRIIGNIHENSELLEGNQ